MNGNLVVGTPGKTAGGPYFHAGDWFNLGSLSPEYLFLLPYAAFLPAGKDKQQGKRPTANAS